MNEQQKPQSKGKERGSPDFASLPAEAFLRLPNVLALVGLSRASVYAKIAERRFPGPIKLGTHASRWRMGDIRAWLADPTGWRFNRDNG